MFILVGLGLYTIFAIFFIIKNRTEAKEVVATEQFSENFAKSDETNKIFYQRVAKGTTVTQMFSYVLSWVLLGFVIFGIIGFINSNNAILYIGFLLFAFTPLTIIANAFWIYPKRIVEAEQWALYQETASNTMKFQRILAWVVWTFYGIIAVVLPLSFLL
jgi:hypothetical protein